MQVNKKDDIDCPNCKTELGAVEKFAVTGQPVPHISDCPECGESFEVRDNEDGTFNVTS